MIFRVPLILLSIAQLAWTRDRVVLLVGNRSNNTAAAAELAPAVAAQLADKGYDVVPPPELTIAAERAGVTNANDEIDPAAAEKLRVAAGAAGVVTVSISFFLGSQPRARGAPAHPAFGLSARMLAGGKTPWSSSLGWIADDVPQPAGFGKRAQPKPTAQACERLLWSLPRGRPDPAAKTVKVADAEPVRGPVSNRWAPPPARLRNFPGVAHFPLKIR